MVYFEWHEEKAARNLREHGVGFPAARAIFSDPFNITIEDSVVDGEQRWRTVGLARNLVVLVVIHLEETDNGDTFIRLISARHATPQERSDYEQTRSYFSGHSA